MHSGLFLPRKTHYDARHAEHGAGVMPWVIRILTVEGSLALFSLSYGCSTTRSSTIPRRRGGGAASMRRAYGCTGAPRLYGYHGMHIRGTVVRCIAAGRACRPLLCTTVDSLLELATAVQAVVHLCTAVGSSPSYHELLRL
jgi:hypothetical protein